jgi:hypothetical protein
VQGAIGRSPRWLPGRAPAPPVVHVAREVASLEEARRGGSNQCGRDGGQGRLTRTTAGVQESRTRGVWRLDQEVRDNQATGPQPDLIRLNEVKHLFLPILIFFPPFFNLYLWQDMVGSLRYD